jgi:Ran GTPase-activating protein (RanGAP) involved in mRNA processing and transport
MKHFRASVKDSSSLLTNLEAKLEAQRSSSVISLSDHCIGDEGCQVLAHFLSKYTTVTDLELRGNNIGGTGITAIANVIRNNYTLKSISLEWNNLGNSDSGLQNFFNALAENRSITKIDLNNNEIGPEVGNFIATCLKSNSTL